MICILVDILTYSGILDFAKLMVKNRPNAMCDRRCSRRHTRRISLMAVSDHSRHIMSPNGPFLQGVYASEPPYSALAKVATMRILPLGTILLADLAEGPLALSHVSEAVDRSPWCPITVRFGQRPADQGVIDAVRALLQAPACLTGSDGPSYLSTEAVVDAVRGRKAPSAREKSAYIVNRTGWKGAAAAALLYCMEHGHDKPEKSGVHRSTIWRRLEKAKPLTPSDWIKVSALVQACCDSQRSLESIALLVGWETSTLRERARTLVGPLFEHRRALAGWEWMLEAVLRKAGYVNEEYPACLPDSGSLATA